MRHYLTVLCCLLSSFTVWTKKFWEHLNTAKSAKSKEWVVLTCEFGNLLLEWYPDKTSMKIVLMLSAKHTGEIVNTGKTHCFSKKGFIVGLI